MSIQALHPHCCYRIQVAQHMQHAANTSPCKQTNSAAETATSAAPHFILDEQKSLGTHSHNCRPAIHCTAYAALARLPSPRGVVHIQRGYGKTCSFGQQQIRQLMSTLPPTQALGEKRTQEQAKMMARRGLKPEGPTLHTNYLIQKVCS